MLYSHDNLVCLTQKSFVLSTCSWVKLYQLYLHSFNWLYSGCNSQIDNKYLERLIIYVLSLSYISEFPVLLICVFYGTNQEISYC